ncbi:hypothetical protein [Nitrosopumilus ureiphilus]|uniref:Uncharacterized protein n=1 Tax=Nitrosopumilus ureiphilus TaxID=1470067 RepID=A0A7D5R5P5_9ARCH|nr:hypothetical protein [Nitrosopumilus ureiphilus]QLH06018.1 hypothetical protein C5F50_02190 [Nitrosopumilus ureiphilus]
MLVSERDSNVSFISFLAPYFLAGFTLPEEIQNFLDSFEIKKLHSAHDDESIVYSGTALVKLGSDPIISKGNTKFSFEGFETDFRFTIPRMGSAFVDDIIEEMEDRTSSTAVSDLFAVFDSAPETNDKPSIQFKLELLMNTLTFQLPDLWKPGKLTDDNKLIENTSPEFEGRVKIVLPKISFVIERSMDDYFDFDFDLKSWGSRSLDDNDLESGDLVRMIPPIAVHHTGRWGFGIENIILDLSSEYTPPDILEEFGIGEGFKGLYIRGGRFYWENQSLSFGFQLSLEKLLFTIPRNDFLIDVSGDVYINEGNLEVIPLIYDGGRKLLLKENEVTEIPDSSILQLEISGGTPPYDINITFDNDSTNHWDDVTKEVSFAGKTNSSKFTISVEDISEPKKSFSRTYDINITEKLVNENDGTEYDRPAKLLPINITINSEPISGYAITHLKSNGNGVETFKVLGGKNPIVKIYNNDNELIDGIELDELNRLFSFEVQENQRYTIIIDFPEKNDNETFEFYFKNDKPNIVNISAYVDYDTVSSDIFQNYSSSYGGYKGINSFKFWLTNVKTTNGIAEFIITAYDAYPDNLEDFIEEIRTLEQDPDLQDNEHQVLVSLSSRYFPGNNLLFGDNPSDDTYYDSENDEEKLDGLSSYPSRILKGLFSIIRNRNFLRKIAIHNSMINFSGGNLFIEFHNVVKDSYHEIPSNHENNYFGKLEVQAAVHYPQTNISATIERDNSANLHESDLSLLPTPVPPRTPKAPSAIKRIGVKFSARKDNYIFGELLLKLDFLTELEKKIRSSDDLSAPPSGFGTDGVFEIKFGISYDYITKTFTETGSLRSDDHNGLLQLENSVDDEYTEFKNILGSLLIAAPLLDDPNAETNERIRRAALGGAMAVVSGLLELVKTKKITLHGLELILQHIRGESFSNAALFFDYSVLFDIDIPALGISSSEPLKVRYNAMGFNLNFDNGFEYNTVFDSSKGYELNLTDPGLFNIAGPLGDIIQIIAVNVIRYNPSTINFDLALKGDTGVISVDKFKVMIPLNDPSKSTVILPTTVKIDIPKTIVGKGSLSIKDVDGGKKISGSIDLTVIPAKLRISAGVMTEPVRGPETVPESEQRKSTAVLVGMDLEFGSPIILPASGLGIYGFSGLFAMHYKRAEKTRPPGSSVSPALLWLKEAGGKPTTISSSLWKPELDKWSFGVGIILGTLDSGVTCNLHGTFMLELPGPRLLIFVKMSFLKKLPKPDDGDIDVGILGVVDLDFNENTLTVGLLVNYDVEKLISIELPVELFFKLDNMKNWHLYIGTISHPAQARILNIVKGSAYFMADGKDIENFPISRDQRITLPGIALATGIEASVIIGNERIGIYLKVSAGAHLGISSSPFLIAGYIHLEGELRLIIISIGVQSDLSVLAPKPTYIEGRICGKIRLLFFTIEGCVKLSIGDPERELSPSNLVTNVYLQSRSPAISEGQGSERPIDASLGNAVAGDSGETLPVVPIDSVPVIQMIASPLVNNVATFTSTLRTPPSLSVTSEGIGWLEMGGDTKVRYSLTSLQITPSVAPMEASAVWRRDYPPGQPGSNTNVELALFTTVPVAIEKALERSESLDNVVNEGWGNICDSIQQAVPTLWMFCGQPYGLSGSGWNVNGSYLNEQNNNDTGPILYVEEPSPSTQELLYNVIDRRRSGQFTVPARIIVNMKPDFSKKIKKKPLCNKLLQLPKTKTVQKNNSFDFKIPKIIRGENNWLRFHVGRSSSVAILLATSNKYVYINQLDASEQLLSSKHISESEITQTPVSSYRDLPQHWLDSSLSSKITSMLESIMNFENLQKLLVTFTPHSDCRIIEIVNEYIPGEYDTFIGAIESLSTTDVERVTTAERINQDRQDALEEYLNNPSIQLLEPDTVYQLNVGYTADIKKDSNTQTSDITQTFKFKTDNIAPKNLNQFMLGTVPVQEEQYHFYGEPIKIVFNDGYVLDLYEKYGKRLDAELHPGNGPDDGTEIIRTTLSEPEPVNDAIITSPFRESITRLAGRRLTCIPPINNSAYARHTLDFSLKPSMSYTFDIVATSSGNNQSANDSAGSQSSSVIEPLFRRNFVTSRYETLKDFVDDFPSQIQHGMLKSQFSVTGDDPVMTLSDQEIQEKLLESVGKVITPPEENNITVFWMQQDEKYVPCIILIDSVEPAWRNRLELRLETVPNQDDPTFKRAIDEKVPSLQIQESNGYVSKFICSPSGTRTIVILSEDFIQKVSRVLFLKFVSPPSNLFDISTTEEPLEIRLPFNAPWEDDSVD